MFGQKRYITATHIREIARETVADELMHHIANVATTELIFERGPVRLRPSCLGIRAELCVAASAERGRSSEEHQCSQHGIRAISVGIHGRGTFHRKQQRVCVSVALTTSNRRFHALTTQNG